jgi:hypothetical protein
MTKPSPSSIDLLTQADATGIAPGAMKPAMPMPASARAQGRGAGAGLARLAGAAALGLTMLGGCAISSEVVDAAATERSLLDFVAAAKDAMACRAAAAAKPGYAVLAPHMPLDDIGLATLQQMIAPARATSDDIAALEAWVRDVNTCRESLMLKVSESALQSFGPLVERGRDADDAVFVKLAQRKITWGEAVVALRVNRTKLRADVIASGRQVVAEIDKAQQQQLNRRADILNAVIRTLP